MVLRPDKLLSDHSPVPWLIGGEWTSCPSATRFPVANPATGQIIAELAYGGAADAMHAADAAAVAFPEWASTSVRARAEVLGRAARLLRERAEAIGHLLARETGKRLLEAVAEVRFAAEYLRYFGEECRRPRGEVLTSEERTRRQLTLRCPAGVAVCLSPWNFPVSIQARKVAPALAVGCTVVARASEKAPLAVMELFRALQDAGAPPGVVNVVHGPAAPQAEALLAHPAVRVLSFTGSTEVGSGLMRLAANRIVRLALELGGDAPFLVFGDADLDAAVADLLIAKFRNNGQSCIAANRVYVERGIFESFVERLGGATSSMRIGDPVTDPACDLGPLIDRERVEAVEGLVAEAIERGARFVGKAPQVVPGACFTRPGFLRDVPDDVGLACREIFGPVAALFPFEDEDEVIALANGTEMGLAGYAYTMSASRQWRLVEALDVGILGLNHALPAVAFAPMGGMKQSGFGREGAAHGLEEFTETRYVSIGTGGD